MLLQFRPSPSFSSPPPTQQTSVDPEAAGVHRAPGRDTTKRIPPLLHLFPPDDAPSVASGVLPLPKRHRGLQNSNSNYNPIWHRSLCCGVKWGHRGLQQTCSAPHNFPGRTDVFRHPPSPTPRPRPPRRHPPPPPNQLPPPQPRPPFPKPPHPAISTLAAAAAATAAAVFVQLALRWRRTPPPPPPPSLCSTR